MPVLFNCADDYYCSPDCIVRTAPHPVEEGSYLRAVINPLHRFIRGQAMSLSIIYSVNSTILNQQIFTSLCECSQKDLKKRLESPWSRKVNAKRDRLLAQLADRKSISSSEEHWLDNDPDLVGYE